MRNVPIDLVDDLARVPMIASVGMADPAFTTARDKYDNPDGY